MTKKKELLFSVTKKDLKLEYFSGTGAGGQKRNKTQNCCRCKHPASGAIGLCQEYRERDKNTKVAFRRMVDSKKFQEWIRIEASRVTGELTKIEEKVERELDRVKLEVKLDGRWTETAEEELSKD